MEMIGTPSCRAGSSGESPLQGRCPVSSAGNSDEEEARPSCWRANSISWWNRGLAVGLRVEEGGALSKPFALQNARKARLGLQEAVLCLPEYRALALA